MIGAGGGFALPSIFTYPAIYSDFTNTSGYTSTSAAITPGEKTLLIFAAGQSRMTNFPGTTTYTPTNATKVQQLNPYDGTTYRAKDPMLGTGGIAGNYLTRLGDELINGGVCQRVIFVPMAISGTGTRRWISDLAPRIETCCRWARAQGWAAPNADLYKAIIWENGQNDVSEGVSSAEYQANIKQIQFIFASQGFPVPFFISLSTIAANVTNATIRAAQAACVNNGELRYAGPDLDVCDVQDGTHLSTTGLGQAATGWKTSLDAVF
jgi:hypothetical protein